MRALGLHPGEERAISGLHITGVDPQQAMQVIVSEPGSVLVFYVFHHAEKALTDVGATKHSQVSQPMIDQVWVAVVRQAYVAV